MQTRIIWKGIDRRSAEHCHILLYESGPVVQGTIIGAEGSNIYKTDYLIKCNEQWHTLSLDLSCHFKDILSEHRLRGDGRGNWTLDGKETPFLERLPGYRYFPRRLSPIPCSSTGQGCLSVGYRSFP